MAKKSTNNEVVEALRKAGVSQRRDAVAYTEVKMKYVRIAYSTTVARLRPDEDLPKTENMMRRRIVNVYPCCASVLKSKRNFSDSAAVTRPECRNRGERLQKLDCKK